ncbi:hypothetical protein NAEX_04700 [Nannocystis exedens]|nr:hypothetical protein NAEX_04700 [Nannocystis exedens]
MRPDEKDCDRWFGFDREQPQRLASARTRPRFDPIAVW